MSRLRDYLQREWDERIERELQEAGAQTHFPKGDTVGGTKGHFLQPTTEETRTWGNNCPFTFLATNDEQVLLTTTQLVHVHRKHPTSYKLLTVVDLTSGWVGELGETWSLTANVIVGVGQAQVNLKRVIPFPVAQITDGAQFSDLVTIPGHAIQCAAVLAGGVAIVGGPFTRTAIVTQLIAPLFA